MAQSKQSSQTEIQLSAVQQRLVLTLVAQRRRILALAQRQVSEIDAMLDELTRLIAGQEGYWRLEQRGGEIILMRKEE